MKTSTASREGCAAGVNWKSLLVFVGIGAVFALVLSLVAPTPPNLQVDGKDLAFWLRKYDLDEPNWTFADAEVCKLGTNAVPYLVRAYGAYEPPWRRWIYFRVAPSKFQEAEYIRLENGEREGRLAFSALASHGVDVVPVLISIYQRSIDRGDDASQMAVLNILRALGPAASGANGFLLQQSRSTNEITRMQSLQALGAIHSNAWFVVPVLINRLSDKSVLVRAAAAGALGRFGTNAIAAIPELIRLHEEESGKVKTWPFSIDDRWAENAAGSALETISNAPESSP